MADSKKPLASVEDAEKASQARVKPGDRVEPEERPEEAAPVRESDPERVAKAVESAKPEVREEQPEVREEVDVFKVEGDTVQPWASGTSNATSLTHSSLELAPNLTESQKATRRRI